MSSLSKGTPINLYDHGNWHNLHSVSKDTESTPFVSQDGNFRLCRHKKAGQQSMYEKPLSGNGVFADNDYYVQSSSTLLVTLERDAEPNKV